VNGGKSPVRLILEYLEAHESVSAKEAAAVCGYGWDNDARRLLQTLEGGDCLNGTGRSRKGQCASPKDATSRSGGNSRPTAFRPMYCPITSSKSLASSAPHAGTEMSVALTDVELSKMSPKSPRLHLPDERPSRPT